MRAADKTANLRTTATARARQVMAVHSDTQEPLRLPDPQIVHLRATNDNEVIDL
jgi:hypothetical protein